MLRCDPFVFATRVADVPLGLPQVDRNLLFVQSLHWRYPGLKIGVETSVLSLEIFLQAPSPLVPGLL